MAARLKRIADSKRFQNTILGVIVVNALTLGLQTYNGIESEYGDVLTIIDETCLGIFCVELAIRIGAFGRRPQDFFKSGWNVFDFVVIGAVFLPGLRENVTLLRLVRLFRVVRVATVLPDMRVLVRGMAQSVKPITTLAVLALLVMYVYGMIGWIIFGDEDPERWGDIGQAMLTLFVMMTLESWPDIMNAGLEVTEWAWVYFVSYILVASFLIINVVIAIIISAVEDARDEERHEAAVEAAHARADGSDVNADFEDPGKVREAIAEVRFALDELEREVGASSTPPRPKRSGRARMASKGRMRP
jgi:voltage-gated sodium channel